MRTSELDQARDELLKALDKFGALKGERFVVISEKEHDQMKEGACLRCRYYGSYDCGASQYCDNKQRLKDLDTDNVWFEPRFDGVDCIYYEYRG